MSADLKDGAVHKSSVWAKPRSRSIQIEMYGVLYRWGGMATRTAVLTGG